MEAPAVEQPIDIDEVIIMAEPKEENKPEPVKTTGGYYEPPLITAQYIEKPSTLDAHNSFTFEKPTENIKQIDLSNVEIGSKVRHKKFGEGTVSKMDKAQKHIWVTFDAGEKWFVFPDAFNTGFLSIISD